MSNFLGKLFDLEDKKLTDIVKEFANDREAMIALNKIFSVWHDSVEMHNNMYRT